MRRLPWTHQGRRILAYLEQRVRECRAVLAEWEAKYERGECEQISVATERAATFEAEYILAEVRVRMGLERYADAVETAVSVVKHATERAA